MPSCTKPRNFRAWGRYHQSAQLVSLAEEILRRCGEYDFPFREAAEQVRHLVYANRNRQIPALVHELLKG